ncbi:g7412 [Coccomyxa viridis]|uniref:G7412 protein n=1 Tax=Coccomyxa viridis TaxID=1274662 RepID=A0ABP1FXU9_9CHLO
MYKELKTWLPASVTLVHLPQTADAGIQATPDYLIRSQPDTACMSTMEAIARALGIMEGDPSIVAALLKPLRLMTALQAEFDPSTHTRMQQGTGSCVTGKSFGFKMPAGVGLINKCRTSAVWFSIVQGMGRCAHVGPSVSNTSGHSVLKPSQGQYLRGGAKQLYAA